MRPRDPQKLGTTQTSLQSSWRIRLCMCSIDPPFCLRGHGYTTVTQKRLFDIFQPSTTKPNQTSSTGQKRKSAEDPQEISGPKKRVFSSKWLEEFAWRLVYVSTENHMKCKTCLDAYGRSAKPSQPFLHGATNF